MCWMHLVNSVLSYSVNQIFNYQSYKLKQEWKCLKVAKQTIVYKKDNRLNVLFETFDIIFNPHNKVFNNQV